MRRILCGTAIIGALACAAPVFAHSDGDTKEVRSSDDRSDRTVRDQDRAARDAREKADDAARAEKRDRELRERQAEDSARAQLEAARSTSPTSGSTESGSKEVSVQTEVGGGGSSGSSGGSDSSSGGSSGGSGTSGGGGDDDSNSGHSPDDIEVADARAPVTVDVDRQGRERRGEEVLVVGSAADVDTVRDRGYSLISRHRLEGGESSIARVRVLSKESVEATIDDLRKIVPDARVSANFLFRTSGTTSEATGAGPASAATQRPRGVVGIVDTGVDTNNVRLLGALGPVRSFVGPFTPREHGTGVAQVVVNSGAKVSVADVFESDDHGAPVASVEAIVRALDWFVAQRVGVVNVSITGPNNAVLADMVARARRHHVVIVAAAGNDGPAAAPAFPAALDGVVAVTAVDTSGRVYRRANRGSYIAFSAVGVRVPVADESGAWRHVSGTSFACPMVAAIVARRMQEQGATNGDAIVRQLANEALDLGPRGRDPIFGWGQLSSE